MDRVLSFGAGVQTTALAIMIAEHKLDVDAVVFADTGAEKPETYSYLEDYTKPLLRSVGVEFITVKSGIEGGVNLYEYYLSHQNIPSVQYRRCTDLFKLRPIHKLIGKKCIQLIGFSADETGRAENAKNKKRKRFPLIEMGMHSADSRTLIQNYGWPIPLKSSCFVCMFQRFPEWNWLKNNHPELFQKALDLESTFHRRKPQMKNKMGLLSGTPLWRLKEGLQPEMLMPGEYACWEGYCAH
jgi:hypothetical protein